MAGSQQIYLKRKGREDSGSIIKTWVLGTKPKKGLSGQDRSSSPTELKMPEKTQRINVDRVRHFPSDRWGKIQVGGRERLSPLRGKKKQRHLVQAPQSSDSGRKLHQWPVPIPSKAKNGVNREENWKRTENLQ